MNEFRQHQHENTKDGHKPIGQSSLSQAISQKIGHLFYAIEIFSFTIKFSDIEWTSLAKIFVKVVAHISDQSETELHKFN